MQIQQKEAVVTVAGSNTLTWDFLDDAENPAYLLVIQAFASHSDDTASYAVAQINIKDKGTDVTLKQGPLCRGHLIWQGCIPVAQPKQLAIGYSDCQVGDHIWIYMCLGRKDEVK